MQFTRALASLAFLFAAVRGHGAITAVKGANGVTGAAFGIDPSTPRDGSRAKPFQQDTSVIRDREIARGTTSACGKTKIGGVNDIATQLAAASSAGLPSTTSAGEVEMTLHQINQDGAGPFTCDVNMDGTGSSFTPMKVTTNVPGFAGLSLATAKDFPLVAQMPAGASCTGGPGGDACIVRCRNSALAGPFGGCVAVTMGDGAAAGGNATAATGGADVSDEAVAKAEAAEAAAEDDTSSAGGGLGGLFEKFGGAGKNGGLAGIFGGLGNRRKRVLKSRIVPRELAGRWI
ncbi:hypothetical protein BKA62DRAFT_328508 [Auriculariales sp. MPI-PUGE-AT-0066]|nr:hypothetical protein BKA62DRAFT_328508 [Auriculariales sp. MPI-PUGE-AT-0066]